MLGSRYLPWTLLVILVLSIVLTHNIFRTGRAAILPKLGTTNYEREWSASGIDPKTREAVLLSLLMALPSSHCKFVDPNRTMSDFAAAMGETEICIDSVVFAAMEGRGSYYVKDHGITKDMTFIQVCQRLQSLIDRQKESTSGE